MDHRPGSPSPRLRPRFPSLRPRTGPAALVASFLGTLVVVLASPWSAGVEPELIEGAANHTCADFEGEGQDWLEHKLEEEDLADGTHSDGTLTVTISNFDGKGFDWSSNIGVDAVFVKAGAAGSNLYRYDPPQESRGDTGLRSPGPGTTNGISHISFCYDADPDARIAIDPPTDANQVGDPHGLTVTVEEKGSFATEFAPAGGVEVALSVSGPGSLDSPTCTTDASGECSVVLTSSVTGLSTVTASADVEVDGKTISVSTDGADGSSEPAVKRWVDATLTLTPAADANDVDDAHTFTATLEFDHGDGAGFVAAPDGEEIAFSTSGVGTLASTACLTDGADGACTVDLTTPTTGLSTVTAAWSGGIATTEGTASADASSDAAVKRWVEARLEVTPSTATNRIGDTHTFAATLEFDTGSGFAPAPAGETIAWALDSGPGALSATSCTTDGSGECSIELDSDVTGLSTVTAAWSGGIATAEGTASSSASDAATKTWVDALLLIDPPQATNQVGDPHVFTITVFEQLVGGTPTPAENVVVTAEITDGPGAFVDGVHTCATDASGDCTVTIVSAEPGLTVVQVAANATVGGLTVPLVTDGEDGNVGPAVKRWVDARLALTPTQATNLVGDTHTFTATLEFDTGAGFGPAPAGETITFAKISGPGALDPLSCATDTSGRCTVDLDSAETGLTRVAAAWSGGITTLEGTGDAVASSDEVVKRWVDGRLTVTPAGATNVVDDTHTFTALLELDLGDGAGFLPAREEAVAFDKVSGPGTLTADGCTTDADGLCTVDLDSPESGTTEVTAAWTGDVTTLEGAASTTLTDAATKDWVTPAIEIVKTADPELGPPRDVTFSYLVTNTGDVTLTNIDVTDDVLGAIGTIDSLEPGGSATLETAVAVDETSPVRNIGTACGDPTADGEVIGAGVCDEDDATITVVLGETIVRPQVLPRTGAGLHVATSLAALLVWLGAAAYLAEDRFGWIRRRR